MDAAEMFDEFDGAPLETRKVIADILNCPDVNLKISGDDFRASFTAAEGWGTYSQRRADGRLAATLLPKFGSVRLRSFGLELPAGAKANGVSVALGRTKLSADFRQDGAGVVITLDAWTTGWRPRDLNTGNFPQLRGYVLQNYFTDEVFLNRLAKSPEEDLKAASLEWMKVWGNSLRW